MKHPRSPLLLTVFALTLLFSSTTASASPDTPEEMGMRPVAKHVYVDPEITGEQAEKLLQLVDTSRQRVATFYGQVVARPNIIFCATADCYRSFGAIGLGYTDGTNIIISPHGWRVTILAHEIAHMELSARIGGFAKVLERVPQWFDEGQAVMVSQAEEFSEEAWRTATHNGSDAPPLSSLESMADWNRVTGANGENMQLSYGTARREVDRWFSTAGRPGFQALLAALANDDEFDTAYSRLEGTQPHPLAAATDEHASPQKASDEASSKGSFARASW